MAKHNNTNGKHSAGPVRELRESEQARSLAHALSALGHQHVEDLETTIQLALEPLHESIAQLEKRLHEQRDLITATADKSRRKLTQDNRENMAGLCAEWAEYLERQERLEQLLVSLKTEVLEAVSGPREQCAQREQTITRHLAAQADVLDELQIRLGRVQNELARPKNTSILPARLWRLFGKCASQLRKEQ